MGGARRTTAVGFVSAFSRLPVHPANTKANNRAMILIRAIPFCQVSKQGRRREWNAIMELAAGNMIRAKLGVGDPYLDSAIGLAVKRMALLELQITPRD
jgi:hypothetical protein